MLSKFTPTPLNEFIIFYSEPGRPVWRVLRTLSSYDMQVVAQHFVQDFSQLVACGCEPAIPDFFTVRGFCSN
jgi:hypothetical protein